MLLRCRPLFVSGFDDACADWFQLHRNGPRRYVLGGAVGTAIGNVLLKRQAGEGDVYWPMGIQLILGAVFLFVASLLAGEGFEVDWTWSFAGAVFVLAVPATALMVIIIIPNQKKYTQC